MPEKRIKAMAMFEKLFGTKEPAPSSSSAAAVPAGLRVYAVGDIHGRADLLRRLLRLIEADNARQPSAEVRLIFLGDYVDRGPASREVIDILMERPAFADKVVRLRGNHEDAMLAFLDDPERSRIWLDWGGMATLASYGVTPRSDLPSGERLAHLSRRLGALMPAAHRIFLEGLPLQEVVGDYLFVHAGVNPLVPLDRQDPFDLTTIRSPFLEWGRPLGKVVVHGHTISLEGPEILSWRIGVDTGAYATGRLTALVLEGESRRVVTT
jgi:serine/threonine protein phosphatase 1